MLELGVHVVDFVYACGFQNFEYFTYKDLSKAETEFEVNSRTEEHVQFLNLKRAVIRIQDIKKNKSNHSDVISVASITFRKLCYQNEFRGMSTVI